MKNIFLSAILLSTVYCANAQYTKLFDFTGATNGSRPVGSLISDGTFLYGMTPVSGIGNYGVIFKINSDGTGYMKLHDFAGYPIDGQNPNGSLIFDGTFLYGVTMDGGINGSGIAFKIKPDGTGYVKLHDFDNNTGPNGSRPFGSLVSDGTFLYGATSTGGTGNGTLFKLKPDGTAYSDIFNFGGINGNQANGSLIYDGTFLYGTTLGGGTTYEGTIFKIKTDGTGYVKLHDFAGATDGSEPHGSLFSDGTFLYGMTHYGGTSTACMYGCGVIFKIKTDGTGYLVMLDFSDIDGRYPNGAFISDGTYLYGMTKASAIGGGNIFKIKTDGTGFAVLYDFGYIDGAGTMGSLISDGTTFYGMTVGGGTVSCGSFGGCGVIFKYQSVLTGIAESNAETDFTIYPNPSSGIFTVNFKNKIVDANICVYDVLGNCLWKKNCGGETSQEINLSSLPKGIYFVETVSDGKRSMNKIDLQ